MLTALYEVKGNHPELYEDLKLYFDGETCGEIEKSETSYLKTVDKEQSGVADREYWLTDDIKWLSQRKDWAGLKAIGCVRRTLNKLNGENTVETRHFITSVTDIGDFAKAVRGHWGIENKIHAPLDITFHDDQNTTMEKHGAQNLQTMKRVALAILGLAQAMYKRKSISTMRYGLSLDYDHEIERIFKLLNIDALRGLLLPKTD